MKSTCTVACISPNIFSLWRCTALQGSNPILNFGDGILICTEPKVALKDNVLLASSLVDLRNILNQATNPEDSSYGDMLGFAQAWVAQNPVNS